MSDDQDKDPGVTVARRIVLAEDEAIIRLDLRETLEDMGFDVVADVGSGEEALAAIREHNPDLAILDIKMGPGPSGLDVAREVTADRLCAVLILTAFSQAELVGQAVEAGVMSYLVKPFQRSSLKPALDVAFARFSETEAARTEAESLEGQLAVRKLLDRAKGVLMDAHGMTEKEAFTFIQQSAMRDRTQMKAVAQRVLDEGFGPDDAGPDDAGPGDAAAETETTGESDG